LKTVVTVLSVIALEACSSGPQPGEDRDAAAGSLVPQETSRPVRVVDATMGNPLPGARVLAYAEAAHPMPGAWSPICVAETGADGIAPLPWTGSGKRASWFYFDARGYGPVGRMGLPEEVQLRRGIDVPVLVLDPFDRPLAGASVEYFLGCGHTPDVQRLTTGFDGGCLLRCVTPGEGHLWIRAAGVAVGSHDLHRGPWTRTDSDGRWRLLGSKPFDGLAVEAEDYPVGTSGRVPATYFQAVPGAPRTVRLKKDIWESEEDAGPKADIRIVTIAADEGARLPDVPVVFLRKGDGYADTAETEVDGSVETELPRGTYRIIAGCPSGRWRRSESAAEVGKDTEIQVALRENPRWRPRLVREGATPGSKEPVPIPWPGEIRLVTSENRTPAVPTSEDRGAVFVPASGPFLLEYADGEMVSRIFFAGPPDGEGPEWVLPWKAPGGPPR
jgi:hypothetical protein